MSGSILTPLVIWKDFNINNTPIAEIISETEIDGIIKKELFIDGRKTSSGQVKIFLTIFCKKSLKNCPAVMVFDDFNGNDGCEIALNLAKKGYMALLINFAGEELGKSLFTIYPEDIMYANYDKAGQSLRSITDSVTNSCWYEWGIVGRYVLEYLSNLTSVTKIGAIGLGEGATILWHLAGTSKLDATVFLMNAGWSAYREHFKFSSDVEEEFSDEMYKYVAGVEPQSYAKHVKCPTLFLSATNNPSYDCDRAYDTISRIEQDIYSAIDYLPNGTTTLGLGAFDNVITFFKEFLSKKTENVALPESAFLSASLEEDTIELTAEVDGENLKKVYLYYSEGIVDPKLRCWQKILLNPENQSYTFSYPIKKEVGFISFFVKAIYKDDFSVCSNIVAKKLKVEDDEQGRSNILFDGRDLYSQSVFAKGSLLEKSPVIKFDKNFDLQLELGPMSIEGLNIEDGIYSFKINTVKDKPSLDSILLMDLYAKSSCEVIVRLVSDYKKQPSFYETKVTVNGADIWHKFKFDISKFKTSEGRILKSFENVNAIEFYSSKECLINNVLWV